MKGAALLAILGVIAIVTIANMGLGSAYFSFVNRIPGRDTTLHFLLFGLLSLLINLAFARSRLWATQLGVPICTMLLVVAITLEEYSQKANPLRHFDLTDLGASVAGVLLFAAAAWGILLLRRPSG